MSGGPANYSFRYWGGAPRYLNIWPRISGGNPTVLDREWISRCGSDHSGIIRLYGTRIFGSCRLLNLERDTLCGAWAGGIIIAAAGIFMIYRSDRVNRPATQSD